MSTKTKPPFPFFLVLLASLFLLQSSQAHAQTQQQQMQSLPTKRPAVILTFDDDWPGQYWYVKPTLEKYGANATFVISCTAVGDVVREEQPQFMMSWDQVEALYDAGFDIQSHGLTHADLTEIPLPEAEKEIRDSKTCIQEQINMTTPITIYANAFAKGGDNKDIVNLVAKYYDFARTGYSNTTYLGCDGWYAEEKNEPPDCRPFNDNGTVKYEHRYQMHTSSHNELDKLHKHNTSAILADFQKFLNATIRYNDDGSIKALPILAYHNVAHLNETASNWINSTTLPETFEAEVQYMHDNGIRMLSMADLEYNNATQKFHIKS